ncbi:MBL fold metallo-hydrolase [Rossellomorea sp. NS-SX7]|uniref:MBL fold metallo-hydrolase n=1 Tax=Rossellomorea sp. NS-SX7 TaxID=3463856 RepID=UPI00405A491D
MIKTFKLVRKIAALRMPVYITMIDDALVDSGPYSLHRQVRKIIGEHQIQSVIHTHHHEDHTGNSPWIEKHMQIPQWIHANGVEKCLEDTKLPFYRSVFWNNRKAFNPMELSGDEFKTKQHTFKIVHTPGHADDHIILIDEENGICLSGDLYLYHSPTSHFSFESVPELIHSLNIALTYSFKEVYCSHGGYLPNGRRLMERKRDFLLNIQETVLNHYREGRTISEIRNMLFPKNKPFQYLSLFENSPIHTVNSIIKK